MKEAAFIYASKQSKDPAIIERVIAAVEHGVSIQHLQRKPIGCPVEHAAYMYAISYPLCTEEQFRLRQAVLFGYNLITHTHTHTHTHAHTHTHTHTPTTPITPSCPSVDTKANACATYRSNYLRSVGRYTTTVDLKH